MTATWCCSSPLAWRCALTASANSFPSTLSSAMSMSFEVFPMSLSRTQPPAHRSVVLFPSPFAAARSSSNTSFSTSFSSTFLPVAFVRAIRRADACAARVVASIRARPHPFPTSLRRNAEKPRRASRTLDPGRGTASYGIVRHPSFLCGARRNVRGSSGARLRSCGRVGTNDRRCPRHRPGRQCLGRARRDGRDRRLVPSPRLRCDGGANDTPAPACDAPGPTCAPCAWVDGSVLAPPRPRDHEGTTPNHPPKRTIL
mmetsp:Transcript_1941/g.12204  ORF Transcript_1941/g.12204 Transcript_1941/m.12204 type:complete len:257 (+) Transcript_1941:2566-3336(+)